jgi:riboflavin synthase
MFTGIVETTGTVGELNNGRLIVRTALAAELKESDSIAINGVCLTALAPDGESVRFDLSPETLMRTNLGRLAPGSPVNLERPLTPTTRLGGHLVQGHVDGMAELASYRRLDEEGNHWLEVRVPPELLRYVAWKGSVALNGISLTIASLEKDILGVAIIPFTHTHTNLHVCGPGDMINIECDLVARYLERLLANVERPPAPETITVDRLIEEGF